jgi:hypothetical protein
MKVSASSVELIEMERACKTYKDKFGEYPPDFAFTSTVDYPVGNSIGDGARNAVLNHLSLAFPRYVPGTSTGGSSTGWAGFVADVKNGWDIDITKYPNTASPCSALTFWLGGKPDWLFDTSGDQPLADNQRVLSTKPVKGFLGFSANQMNPFDASSSRIAPFYSFDLNCLCYEPKIVGGFGLAFWPTNACVKGNNFPIVYFRASNSTYYSENTATNISITKHCILGQVGVYPAVDTSLIPSSYAQYSAGWVNYISDKSSTPATWANKDTLQIFCSGLDGIYAPLTTGPPGQSTALPQDRLLYPDGGNYGQETYYNITNFSGGTLESKVP